MPMWILIAQIYWKDLLRARKYGRRLVFALLSHLHIVRVPRTFIKDVLTREQIHKDPDRDILVQLSSKLSTLLDLLIKSNPESFICPSSWPRYRDTLLENLPSDCEPTQKAFNAVHQRNSRLLINNCSSLPAGRKQLVRLLDGTLREPDRELATKCWATSDNKQLIVRTLVEWATSFHRPGLAKVYIATNLLQSWDISRNLPTSAILDLLVHIDNQDKTRQHLIYHLVTELVRIDMFSVSRYMQWVIARGGYHSEDDVDPDGPCSTRLLVELPLHALSDKKKSERGSLLRRAGNYSVAQEELDISNALKCIRHMLGLPLPPDDPLCGRKPMSLKKLLRRVGNSSKALKSCIGAYLRDIFTSPPFTKGQVSVSFTVFTSLRAILEAAEDFYMLSDILLACTKTASVEVLASCADTVHSNLQVFYAIGSADDLFNGLIERLKSINEQHGIAPRPLLASLSSLSQRMTGHETIASQLRHELLQSDRSNAIDACSPVSDNMMAPVQSAEGEVAEEIEKLLAGGTNLDPPTMNRLFRTIIPRLENGWRKKDETRRVFATLLARIRIFDTNHFDKLMTDWTSHLRTLPTRPLLTDLLPLLISTGCLTMSIVLSTASAPSPSYLAQPTQHGATTYLQELLQFLIMPLPTDTGLSAEETYSFRTEQQCAKTEHSKGLLNLVRNALLEYSALKGAATSFSLPLNDDTCQKNLLDTLRLLVLVDSTAVSSALSIKSLPTEAAALAQKLTNKLLAPGDDGSTQMSFDQILQLANELTLPFCQLKLNLDLSMSQTNPNDGDDHGSLRFDLFAKAMDRAIEAGNIMWTSLLPCLSDDITQHLKHQAYTGILDLMPSLKAPSGHDATSNQPIRMAENLLDVVEAIITGHPPPKAAHLTLGMVDKVSDLWEIVASGAQEHSEVRKAVLNHWIPAMLRFVTLSSLSSESPSAPLLSASASKLPVPTSHDIRARMILVLCGLLLELETLPCEDVGSLPQQVFDIAILLVDALPEDVRSHCAKMVLLTPGSMPSANLSSDPKLYYLFSTPHQSPTDNLMYMHREKPGTQPGPRGVGALYGIGPVFHDKLSPFVLRRWEVLSEPTPNVGENDTSLSLGLFEAIKLQ